MVATPAGAARAAGLWATEGRASQWVFSGAVKTADMRHDVAVYRAACEAHARIEAAGGRVVRIRIDAELKGQVAAQAERARQARGRVEAAAERRRAAAELDLPMARGKVLFPDAQIEYVTAAGVERGPSCTPRPGRSCWVRWAARWMWSSERFAGGRARIRIWRRRWRVTSRETTANEGCASAGGVGELDGCDGDRVRMETRRGPVQRQDRRPQACGRDARPSPFTRHRPRSVVPPGRPPHTGGGMTKLLTLREVTQMTALSRSAVYVLMGTAQFPPPIRIGRRAVRWVEQEVLDFIASPGRSEAERNRSTAWTLRVSALCSKSS